MARAESLEEYRALATEAKGKPDRIARPKRRLAIPFPTEHDEQVALFAWAERAKNTMPSLAMLFAIPNAGAGAQAGQAGKMKGEGVKPGVPDVCLPVPMNGYHGMYLEMKRVEGGVVSDAQKVWLEALTERGYYCVVARGFDEARDRILDYVHGRVPERAWR